MLVAATLAAGCACTVARAEVVRSGDHWHHASVNVKMGRSRVPAKTRIRHERRTPPRSRPPMVLDRESITLTLSEAEAAMLQTMLREQVTNELDMLEDLAYLDLLGTPASEQTIGRIALAVRLDVQMC